MSLVFEHWESCKKYLEKNVLLGSVYKKWISPIQFLGKKEGKITLGLPEKLNLEEFTMAYLGLIKNYFDLKLSNSIQVSVKKMTTLRQKSSSLSQSKCITNTYFETAFSFDQFVLGDHVEFAYKSCLSICENLGKIKFNPLFIYAGKGLGKTHLIQAIGNAIRLIDSSLKLHYVDCGLFHQDFVESIKNNQGLEFFEYYSKNVDILLFDDIHFLASKWATQEEFFHIFNALYQSKKQIILTSLESAKTLDGIEERLISRFQSGLMVGIHFPNQEVREAIIQEKLKEGNLVVEQQIVSFIAEKIKENIPLMMSVVKQMLIWSSSGRKVTLEIVTQMVSSIVGNKSNKRFNSNDILRVVCDYFNVNPSFVISKARGNKTIVEIRQIAMYLIKKKESASLQTIGKKFGGRDHSTVKKSINLVQKKMEADCFFNKKVEAIFRKIDV